MSETKQFPKRIQDILYGLELRTGKRKVQTKEDLKKCFRKECVNAYSAEDDGKPRGMRMMARPMVVLPEPDSPTRPKVSPL